MKFHIQLRNVTFPMNDIAAQHAELVPHPKATSAPAQVAVAGLVR
jgi:hypothetical protein